jgi:hypothetical protein
MLTIQNPTKGAGSDTGIVIGSFKLVNAGLYNRPDEITGISGNYDYYSTDISGNYDYYSFYWNYNDERSRFKCFLERNPIEGTTSIYRFEIYDVNKGFTHYSKRGLIYSTSVGTYTHLKDRIGFYSWMVNQMVKHM